MTFEDQQSINAFNKLFTRSQELEAELKAKKAGLRCHALVSCATIFVNKGITLALWRAEPP